MTDATDREENLSAVARLNAGGAVTDADVHALARGLLEIAHTAMPSSFFADDSRCRLARAVLDQRREGQ